MLLPPFQPPTRNLFFSSFHMIGTCHFFCYSPHEQTLLLPIHKTASVGSAGQMGSSPRPHIFTVPKAQSRPVSITLHPASHLLGTHGAPGQRASGMEGPTAAQSRRGFRSWHSAVRPRSTPDLAALQRLFSFLKEDTGPVFQGCREGHVRLGCHCGASQSTSRDLVSIYYVTGSVLGARVQWQMAPVQPTEGGLHPTGEKGNKKALPHN